MNTDLQLMFDLNGEQVAVPCTMGGTVSSVADTVSLRHAGLPGVSGESHAGGVEAQVQDEHARGG